MFVSKSVNPISDVDLGMDLDLLVWISGFESVLSGLVTVALYLGVTTEPKQEHCMHYQYFLLPEN